MIRNPRLFNVPNARTTSYKKSFFPHTLDMWNELDDDTRNITSLSGFKNKLSEEIEKPPLHFSVGPRKLNIIYCQLRDEVSNLNHHLFNSHLSESSSCACGGDIEDNYHYLYICPLYSVPREHLFARLRAFSQILSVHILLHGSADLSLEENTEITKSVLEYIESTERFQ